MGPQHGIVLLAEGVDEGVAELVPYNLQKLLAGAVFGQAALRGTCGAEQRIDIVRPPVAADVRAKSAVVQQRAKDEVVAELAGAEISLDFAGGIGIG